MLTTVLFVLSFSVQAQTISNPNSRAAATPTPTPTSIFSPGRTPFPIATATPTPTSFVIVIPDLSISNAVISDSLLIAIPPEDAVIPATVLVTVSGGLAVPELDLSVSLLGSDGVEDASWTVPINGGELTGDTSTIDLSLPLQNFTPLEVDAYNLFITADPMMRLADTNRGNNLAISAPASLLHTSGKLLFGSIETTLDETTTFILSPPTLNGTADYSGQTVTFTSLEAKRNAGTLDLEVHAGKAQFADIDPFEIDGWSYRLENGRLDNTGAEADVYVYLPETISHRLQTYPGSTLRMDPLGLGLQPLGQELQLTASSIPISDPILLYAEGIPLNFAGDSAAFSPGIDLSLTNPHAEYIHHARFMVAPGERPGNDGLFNTNWTVNATVTASGLQAGLQGDASEYQSLFPYGANIKHGRVTISITDGQIQSSVSAVDGIDIQLQTEVSACESGSYPAESFTYSFADSISLSSDGSIAYEGELGTTYTFGFNTFSGDTMSRVAWYQPGFVLHDSAPVSTADQVDQYLLAGRSETSEDLYYDGSTSYTAGEGYYAGINLMTNHLQGMSVNAVIGGSESLDVTLNEGSKFYIRWGGYTGTIDATLGADSELELYPDPECGDQGYAITLTSFGQAYLDNDSEGYDTKIAGQIDLPYPAGIDIPFEDMTLDPCGNFTDGAIPEDELTETRTLDYWLADLRLSTVGFEQREGGGTYDKTLWISSVNTVEGLGDEPLMQLNFRPCGSIANSLVAEPVDTTIDDYGTTLETLYLTTWDGDASPNGFYSFANFIDVPFFDSPRVHSQMRPSSHRLSDGSQWDDDPEADADHDGWPDDYSPSGASLTDQFYNYSEDRKITLETEVGGVLPLAYEVKYSPSDTSFESSESLGQDLLIIDIQSAISHLDQEHAEITFGIGIEGLPDLNFSSAADGVGDVLEDVLFDAVRDKLDELSDSLSGDISVILRPILREMIHDHVERALNDLQSQIEGLPRDEAEAIIDANIGNVIDNLMGDIDLYSSLGSETGDVRSEIVTVIQNIIDVLEEVSTALQFSVDDIEGMVGDIIDLALEALDLFTDFDVEQVLTDVEEVQQRLVEPIDEILAVLYEAEAVLTDPLTLDSIFTTANIDVLDTSIREEFEDFFVQLDNIEQIETMDADELTDMILDSIFNSSMFQAVNSEVSEWLIPVKEMLYEQATLVLDELNDVVDDFLEQAAGITEGTESEIKNVNGFRGAEMEGYAIISGDVLEKLHIDASLELAIPDEMTFSGYLDITRYEVENSGKTCLANLEGDSALDIRVGATDVDLSWTGSDLIASIEFAMMLDGPTLVNVGGSLITEGTIDFEAVAFSDLGFGLAVGQVENYIWAMGKGQFDKYSVEGGIFLGTSCTLEPLEILDPEVASLLTIDEMRGVFASVGASFPIYNYGCVFTIAAEAEVAAWYFADGPTYGGKLVAGAYGEGLCVVSVKGELTLIGGREGSAYYFYGQAWVAGGAGDCEPEDWDTLNDAFNDKWCYACGTQIDLTFIHEEWEVDYDVECN